MTALVASPLRGLAPGLVWAVIILVLTSVPGRDVPEVHIAQIDKAVHMLLHKVFAALITLGRPGVRGPGVVAAIVVSTSLIGAIDEWHQQFMPGRSQNRCAWLFDAIGAGAGVLFITFARARRESAS